MEIDDDLILRASARSLNIKDQASLEIHDLEFGVRFPEASALGEGADGDDPFDRRLLHAHEPGDLVALASISTERDPALVPGELFYEYNRLYFDRRSNPPQEQVEEVLYYAPCAVCGRPSNDQDCRCASQRSS